MPKRYYARLLRHYLENPALSFNSLEKTDPGLSQWLHTKVWEVIDSEERVKAVPPFLILMNQAKSDALKLTKNT